MTRTARQAKAASTIAKILLETKAVNFRPSEPYKLTAGWASPVYIDCRWLISFPWARKTITLLACEEIRQKIGIENIDTIAGGETAGIPYASWISESLGLPMVYVRKSPKGFGRMSQIEGNLPEKSKSILIEDLATDGGSKIKFVDAIRKAGAECSHALVVFFYDVFPGSLESLKKNKISLSYLCTWLDVIETAEKLNSYSDSKINEVRKFLDNPIEWSERNGGRGKE